MEEESMVIENGRSGEREEVEKIEVIKEVIGNMIKIEVIVEIDGKNMELNEIWINEMGREVKIMRNVIKKLIVEGRGGGWSEERKKKMIKDGEERKRIE